MNELSKVEALVKGHPGVSAAVLAGAGLLAYRHYRANQATAASDGQAIAPVGIPAGVSSATGTDSLFASDTSPVAAGTSGSATGGTYSLQVPTGYPVPPTYQSITPPSGYQSEADAGYAAVGGGLRGSAVSATVSSANTLGDACSPKLGERGCNPTKCSGIFGCIGKILSSVVTCPVAVATFAVNCGARTVQTGVLAGASAGLVAGQAVSKIPGVAGTPWGMASSLLGGIGAPQNPNAGYAVPYQQQSPYGYPVPSPYVGYGTPYGFTPPIAPYVQPGAPVAPYPAPVGKQPAPAVQQYGLTLV